MSDSIENVPAPAPAKKGETDDNNNTMTGGNKTTMTGGNKTTMTGGNKTTMTGGNKHTMTGGNKTTMTGGNKTTMTGGKYSKKKSRKMNSSAKEWVGFVVDFFNKKRLTNPKYKYSQAMKDASKLRKKNKTAKGK